MNKDILKLLNDSDDFTRKVMLQGFLRNCEFWGKRSSERVFEFEEKLNSAIEHEKSDDYIAYLEEQLSQAQAQLANLRKLYRAASTATKNVGA